MRLSIAHLNLLILASLATPSAQAQTDWFVDAAGVPPGNGTINAPFTSIQFGLAQSSTLDGDRLLVASGTYSESIDFLGKDVIVTHDGSGPMPRIEGDGMVSAVRFVSGESEAAQLVRFVVTGSVPSGPNGVPGGGILIDGATPALEEVIVRDCSAGSGGGIAVLSGGLTLVECQVLENITTGSGGGILIEAGDLLVVGGEIRANVADNLGFANLTGGGGLAALENTAVTIQNTVIGDNRLQSGQGAGIFALGAIDLDGAQIVGNRALSFASSTLGGGGISAPLATGINCLIQFNGGFLTGNAGGAWGGTWTDSTFRANSACGNGGGLFEGSAWNCLIEGNSLSCEDAVGGNGAGANGSTLVDCTILGNISDGNGGGTWDCTLDRCVVRGNECSGSFFGDRGGVALGSATDCLIEGNKVLPNGPPFAVGGGAFNASLVRCIVRGNIAPDGGAVQGGTLDRCTVVHNASTGTICTPDVSAVANAMITNSILWGNGQVEHDLSTISYSNVQGGALGVGNFSSDPQFFGTGSDVHLLSNSPCIDTGDPAAALDPDGSRADIGAIPFEPLHRREDAPFCFGLMDLVVDGELSASFSTAILTSPGATAFIASLGVNYTPLVFLSPTNGPGANGLCLNSPFVRIPPSATDTLALTPTVLNRLGLAPGDRLYVQAFRIVGSGVETSPGLDLLVRP